MQCLLQLEDANFCHGSYFSCAGAACWAICGQQLAATVCNEAFVRLQLSALLYLR